MDFSLDSLNLWLHVLGTAFSFGGAVFVAFYFIPHQPDTAEPGPVLTAKVETFRAWLYANLFAMLVTFMTGVFNLFKYKEQWGSDYFAKALQVLGFKFFFVLLFVLMSSMASMGLGLKYIRIATGLIEVEDRPAMIRKYEKKLWRIHIVLAVLIAIIAFFGIQIVKIL
ncbi:MAG: hypothetical protein AB1405_17785 [Bdellovibrionota bacterium]